MLKVIVENGNIDKAVNQYKRKFTRVGVAKELRSRQEYIKPSVTKRRKIQKAIYKEKYFNQNEQ